MPAVMANAVHTKKVKSFWIGRCCVSISAIKPMRVGSKLTATPSSSTAIHMSSDFYLVDLY